VLNRCLLATLVLAGCKPALPPPPTTPTPAPAVSPTPTPKPTPEPTPFIKRKPMDTGMIFNGLQYKWTVETEEGSTAARDREKDGSYRLELNLKIRTPQAATTLEDLKVANSQLPEVLPSLPLLLETAKVSPDYEDLYRRKMSFLKDRLEQIEQILSRHNYYDCDTVLELKHPESGRKALLVQGDMDVNVDGSDGDRNIEIDGSNQFFQPQTSYRWPKTTDRPNPFIAKYEERIAKAEVEAAKPETTDARTAKLREEISSAKRNISDLKSASFLVSQADPSVVLPGFMMGNGGPKVGDYVVVVHGEKMYPAILGDAGPSYKVGEASLRLCREIGHTGTALARPVSGLEVTYLVFPGSADEKRSAPDLERWHMRCSELLAEIGVTNTAALHHWENIVPPWPTPTPVPTPMASVEEPPGGVPTVDTGGSQDTNPSALLEPAASATASPLTP